MSRLSLPLQVPSARARALAPVALLACLLLVLLVPSSALATNRPPTAGHVLGQAPNLLDTYVINLNYHQGVAPRDVFQVYRQGQAVAEAVVIYAGPVNSLVLVRGSRAAVLQRGDAVQRMGRIDLPPVPPRMSGESIVVRERDVMSSRSPGAATFSAPSFSNPSFSQASFSNPGFSSPSFSQPGY